MPISGPELRLERQRANLTIKEIAQEMGLTRQSLWSLERAAVVPASRALAYRAAVLARVASRDGVSVVA